MTKRSTNEHSKPPVDAGCTKPQNTQRETVEAFLARGGTITAVAPGVSGFHRENMSEGRRRKGNG